MADTILMCEHIAIGNPIQASELCYKYGYSVDETSPQHIAETLTSVLAENNNEETLKDVCNLHPDKKLILELFQPENKYAKLNACGDCKHRGDLMMRNYERYPYFNATGASNTSDKGVLQNIISMQTNTILVIGVILIGGAILLKK